MFLWGLFYLLDVGGSGVDFLYIRGLEFVGVWGEFILKYGWNKGVGFKKYPF